MTHKDMVSANRGDRTQSRLHRRGGEYLDYMTMMERGNCVRFHRVAQLSNAGS
jgi:hypothetical protein